MLHTDPSVWVQYLSARNHCFQTVLLSLIQTVFYKSPHVTVRQTPLRRVVHKYEIKETNYDVDFK